MLVGIAKLKSIKKRARKKRQKKEVGNGYEELNKVFNIKQFDQWCEIKRTNWGPKGHFRRVIFYILKISQTSVSL